MEETEILIMVEYDGFAIYIDDQPDKETDEKDPLYIRIDQEDNPGPELVNVFRRLGFTKVRWEESY